MSMEYLSFLFCESVLWLQHHVPIEQHRQSDKLKTRQLSDKYSLHVWKQFICIWTRLTYGSRFSLIWCTWLTWFVYMLITANIKMLDFFICQISCCTRTVTTSFQAYLHVSSPRRTARSIWAWLAMVTFRNKQASLAAVKLKVYLPPSISMKTPAALWLWLTFCKNTHIKRYSTTTCGLNIKLTSVYI